MATIPGGKNTFALGAFDTGAELYCFEIGRPEPGPLGVAIDIAYCGMCHSDVHALNGDWGMNSFPLAPGHEISGIVKAVGPEVTKFKVGDRVGVGCMVASCGECDLCKQGLENHCPNMTQTYGNVYPEGTGKTMDACAGHYTNGGYSTNITVNEKFVFKIPDKMDMSYAGVLLCAGITTFSPLNRHILKKGGGKGKAIAVLGFGGLASMAVKLATAMNVDSITVLSRSNSKKEAAEKLGCKYLVYTNEDEVKAATRTFDVIMDTVAAPHDVAGLMGMLKVGGTMVMIGGIPKPFEVSAFALIFNKHAIEGSLIGGVPETQEMLDFCAEHDVVPEFRVIKAAEADEQFKKLMAGAAPADRAVIDMSTLKELEVVTEKP